MNKRVFAVAINKDWVQLRVGTKPPTRIVTEVTKDIKVHVRSELVLNRNGYYHYEPVEKVKKVTIKIASWEGGRSLGNVPLTKLSYQFLINKLELKKFTEATKIEIPEPLASKILDTKWRNANLTTL